jgi:uncharacterized protein
MKKRYAVRAGRSSVAGLGLFATGDFRKGAVLCEYTGPLVKAGTVDNRYTVGVDGIWDIDGSPRSNVARYANHICGRPNAYFERGSGKRVWLKANRSITAGEEIFVNYGRANVAIFSNNRCRCPRCQR